MVELMNEETLELKKQMINIQEERNKTFKEMVRTIYCIEESLDWINDNIGRLGATIERKKEDNYDI